MSWFEDLFINEAKPALNRHSGSGGGTEGGDDLLKSIVTRTIAGELNLNYDVIGSFAFYECKNITKVKFPNAIELGTSCMYNCTSCEEIEVPNCEILNREALFGCKFKSVTFPKVKTVSTGALRNCTQLEYADFYTVTKIQNGQHTFSGCSKLRTLILRASTVCSLGSINSFAGTPFADGQSGGVLLITSALVESYKMATNWSIIYGYGTNSFLALEDYTVDGTTTGEINWAKINALLEEVSA